MSVQVIIWSHFELLTNDPQSWGIAETQEALFKASAVHFDPEFDFDPNPMVLKGLKRSESHSFYPSQSPNYFILTYV